MSFDPYLSKDWSTVGKKLGKNAIYRRRTNQTNVNRHYFLPTALDDKIYLNRFNIFFVQQVQIALVCIGQLSSSFR